VDVTISGASTFKGTLKGNCEINNNEHSVTIDAASGSTVFLRFFVQQVAQAPFTIVMEGLTPPKTAAYGRFNELKVGQDRYVATSGKGTLDDAAGRAGRFVANEFIRAAVASVQAPVLRAEISWKPLLRPQPLRHSSSRRRRSSASKAAELPFEEKVEIVLALQDESRATHCASGRAGPIGNISGVSEGTDAAFSGRRSGNSRARRETNLLGSARLESGCSHGDLT
jgi:hypothetical protein